MSKFCGVFSHNNKSNGSKLSFPLSMSFCQLEVIFQWLMQETQSLYEDFNTRCSFQQCQQIQVLDNELNITDMHDEIEAIKANVMLLEMQAQENENQLELLEKSVQTLGQMTEIHTNKCSFCQSNTKYQHMLQLLERTSTAMQQLEQWMQQINDFDQYPQMQGNPYNIILAILDMHVHILLNLDRNISALTDKSTMVDEGLSQVLDKINKLRQIAGIAVNFLPVDEVPDCNC